MTPLSLVRGVASHCCSVLAPLDALHPMLHSAMFSTVAMPTSLMMCSHERFFGPAGAKSVPQ